MKKILFLFLFFSLLPIGNVLAANDYNNGLLDEVSFEIVVGSMDIFDNNEKTAFRKSSGIPNVHIRLTQEVDVTGFYINAGYFTGSQSVGNVGFYDKYDKLIGSYTFKELSNKGYFNVNFRNVKAIKLNFSGGFNIYEFDIFGTKIERDDIDPVGHLTVKPDYSSVLLSWVNPTKADDLKNIIVRQAGKEIANLPATSQNYLVEGLIPENDYSFDVVAKYSDGEMSDTVNIKAKTNKAPKIIDLKAVTKHDSATLRWTNPVGSDFNGVSILSNGQKVVDLGKGVNSYDIKSLDPQKKYTYEVVALYSGFRSDPVAIEITTLDAPLDAGDVVNLTADAKHNRVDLKWVIPDSDIFKHVNIYRETLKKSLFDKMLGINTVMAATPIFETNGTYFNDLTVKSETKYEYTLTTTSMEKVESDGVSVIVTTLEDPTPEIGGGGYDKDPESGDYTYYWTEPTTGKVKVMVGGKLHATVEAVNGKIIIPAASMKFTILGKPDVQLIPVDEEGNEGKPVKPPSGGGNGGGSDGGIDGLPFTESELMKGVFELLKLVGPYIVVALAFYLAPRFIEFIKKSIKQSKEGKKNVE